MLTKALKQSNDLFHPEMINLNYDPRFYNRFAGYLFNVYHTEVCICMLAAYLASKTQFSVVNNDQYKK